MSARRSLARWRRHRVGGTWPIDEKAAKAPEAWPGWPGGKKFAFVLTHDVEGRRGLDRCRELARLEMRLGFRSSFNFVPEGEYSTPEPLRRFLADSGFEIGVHDLHHDGKLYRSREAFKLNAQRINTYLRSWGAVGFRSGFMLHNLDWLRDLDTLYDASTFDTDPFEPQPDAARTIFPFWVGGTEGYVELPYTLPQDSTMFLVLGEKNIDIWTRKLDWLANRGGMALVNVHPDYMTFDRRKRAGEYPADLYAEFLAHATARYSQDAWFALPRDVAGFYREHVGRSGLIR
jgi:peptidoglycan/xylan/chitin deacetylase (PgdA/CDA1 family)